MVNIEVKKRDGSLEHFNSEKIKRVVIAAGLSDEQGKKLALTVSDFISSLDENPVSSKTIRDKVIQELEKVHPYAAGLFAWYEKTKEKNS